MDKLTRESCLEEISHWILDVDRKVSIIEISNKWNIPHPDSESILQEWIETHPTEKLLKEFVFRGYTKDDQYRISVVPERDVNQTEEKFRKFVRQIWTVERMGETTRRLPDNRIVNDEEIFVTIKIPDKPRKPRDNRPPVKPGDTIQPTTSVNKPDNSSITDKKPEVLDQKPPAKELPVQKTPETKKVSPKKEKETPKTKANKKNVKNTINSFFSAKPTVPKIKDEEKPISIEQPKENKPIESRKVPSVSHKRKLSETEDDEVVFGTPQPTKEVKSVVSAKKSKTQPKKPGKRSRILVISDSSGDEDNEDVETDSPDKEAEQLKNEEDLKENLSENEQKEVGNRKGKTKRTVQRTYQDEEGFFVTKAVVEYYSDPDEVVEVPIVKPKEKLVVVKPIEKPEVKPVQETKNDNKSKPRGKAAAKPVPKKGMITNFFTRK